MPRRLIAALSIAGAMGLSGCAGPLTFLVAPVRPVHVGTPQVMPPGIGPDVRTWGAWAYATF